MSEHLRHIYAEKALSQIPRLLTLQDRNPFSPTYGCFKRTYWLDKTVDFPDALPQFGVLSLALAYAFPFSSNPHPYPLPSKGEGITRNIYYQQPKIREWILAGMKFWAQIQHRDGSFDEFYPNEHGWTGPTGFLLYAMLKSYMILEERQEFPADFRDQFFTACRKAADYIVRWDEHGVLANHHAMAVLPVHYAFQVLQEERFREGYEKKLKEFLSFCNPEGWSLEYDGADIGYLSATVSFLGKVWKINRDPRLKEVMEKGVEFLSYFVYPNGFYAGSMGSRNTLHFYPHGCELLAPTMPLAGRVADAMLESLRDGKIVPAEIMDDRYFLYRIPEHMESYIDYGERIRSAKLPYEGDDVRRVFPLGRFYMEKKGNTYLVANAAKGGVLKAFDVPSGTLILNDCGMIGRTKSGKVVTSQWVDDAYAFVSRGNGFSVSGLLKNVPANTVFTPAKMILFRLFLILFGWHTGVAYRLKGFIRKLLMLKSGTVPGLFYRSIEWEGETLRVTDIIKITGKMTFVSLQLGDEFFVRYVPQSRYFQSQELETKGWMLDAAQLQHLNHAKKIHLERTVDLRVGTVSAPLLKPLVAGTMGLEYSEGRKKKLSLTYRLQRRADEVIRGIRMHFHGQPRDLLDLGPAEGKVLSKLKEAFPQMTCTGLEYSKELIDACEDSRLKMVQGDAMHPPFEDRSFDVVTASALIEHVDSPGDMLREAWRVLRPGGIVIVTTPDPFFEHIATAIGHLPEEQHQETMTLKTLDKYLRCAGFEPVDLQKFMVSPWGVPGELSIETFMKKIGLAGILLNQLAIGRKPL